MGKFGDVGFVGLVGLVGLLGLLGFFGILVMRFFFVFMCLVICDKLCVGICFI